VERPTGYSITGVGSTRWRGSVILSDGQGLHEYGVHQTGLPWDPSRRWLTGLTQHPSTISSCDNYLDKHRSRDHRRSQKGKCLRAIYFIDRTDGRQFVIQPMSSLFSKYMIFTRVSRVQLLGRYFAANMNRIISIMVQTLRVYRLLIPNDIGFLCSNAQELLDLLQQ